LNLGALYQTRLVFVKKLLDYMDLHRAVIISAH